MKLNDLLIESWKEVINKNAKWGFSVFFRGLLAILGASILILVLQWFGYIKSPSNPDGTVIIEPGGAINISKPGTVDYKPTIKDLDSTIEMLKKKKEELKKDEVKK